MNQLILTTEEGEALHMFEGKKVIPLDSASANYREWLYTTYSGTQYCIVDDHDTWTVLRYEQDSAQWVETTVPVAHFLRSYRLILAA